ncbi:GDT1-like protein 3 [Dichanthelium oligosanthes]|uniref:GDT1 family protein n=1 Tax=Dichanthelium oligosanthes TaxID=888268 RepID=A0A1E5WF65_9POAL|nr:GDT1-like protein 3 [Dichanthelium oligosanthes]
MDPNPRVPLLLAVVVLLSLAASVVKGLTRAKLESLSGGLFESCLLRKSFPRIVQAAAEDNASGISLGRRAGIGDETFIIAALMAMRHPKSIVLSGALSALYVMTVLSTGLGRIVPNLISRKHTNSAATGTHLLQLEFCGVCFSTYSITHDLSSFGLPVLYLFFGLRLLYIAWKSDPKGSQKKEMEEVEEKLESGQGKSTIRRFFARFCTPIFLEVSCCYLMKLCLMPVLHLHMHQ